MDTKVTVRTETLLISARRAAASGSLRDLRLRARLTQVEAGASCGVSGPAWARWEHGDRVPRGEAALALGRLVERLERRLRAHEPERAS